MTKNARISARKLLAMFLATSAATGMWGCEVDSFLDPSVTGRWEATPTIMPVLDRLSVIEDEAGDFVQASMVQPGDLIPEIDSYRLGSGDQLEIRIRDYYTMGIEEAFDRSVDTRGVVELPRLPAIRAQGRSVADFTTAIEEAIRSQRINDRPVVSVNPRSQRKQTFNVLGAARNPGSYFIPSPDYRLLEGITAAGGMTDESQPFVYIIRQVALSDEAAGILPPAESTGSRSRLLPGGPAMSPSLPAEPGQPPKRSEELIELIDELSKPAGGGGGGGGAKPMTPPSGEEMNAPAPSPSMVQPRGSGSMGSASILSGSTSSRGSAAAPQPTEPSIDLPDANSQQETSRNTSRSGWVYLDGKWIKLNPGSAFGQGAGQGKMATGGGGMGGSSRQVAQRVIKVPTSRLLAGSADVNVVLRPGDVVRLPPAKAGLVYLAGQVARPGPYSLPTEGKLTLLRAIDSAGGLSGLAIPERVDLTRVVGENRQATIRLNLRAIAEQTQPDIYVKPDDRINIGTNFFAVPLAVFRGGFRASYGFGFILDRNFQGDVFGVDQAINRN